MPVKLAQNPRIPIAEVIFFMDLEIISKTGTAKMMYYLRRV